MIVGCQKLYEGETSSTHNQGGPDAQHSAPAGHHPDEPNRNDERKEGKLSPGHGAEVKFAELGDVGQGQDGRAQGAKGDRRRIGEKSEPGGIKGSREARRSIMEPRRKWPPGCWPAAPSTKAPKLKAIRSA